MHVLPSGSKPTHADSLIMLHYLEDKCDPGLLLLLVVLGDAGGMPHMDGRLALPHKKNCKLGTLRASPTSQRPP